MRRTTRPTAVLVLAGLFALGACSEDKSSVDETTRDESGDVTEGGDLGVLALEVGDCIVAPEAVSDEGGEVDAVEAVPCDQPHDAQVFAEHTIADFPDADDFPGSAAIQESVTSGCLEQWTDAIGTEYETDEDYDLSWVEPTEFSWEENDDRGVTCMVIDIAGEKLTGDLLG